MIKVLTLIIDLSLGSCFASCNILTSTNDTIYTLTMSQTSDDGSISPNAVTYPDGITDICIKGDASQYDTVVCSTPANALPVPSDGTTIHFLLTNAPSTDPVYWFYGSLGANCRVVIEPGSPDPWLSSVLGASGLQASSNILVVGAPISIPSSLGTIACNIQRHPNIAAIAATSAVITINTNTEFQAALNGISINAGTIGLTMLFSRTSDIIDPSANLGRITIAADQQLSLCGLSTPLPTMSYRTITPSGADNYLIGPNQTIEPLDLPTLSPALLSVS